MSAGGRARSDVTNFPGIIFALDAQTWDFRFPRPIGIQAADIGRNVVKHPMGEAVRHGCIGIMKDQNKGFRFARSVLPLKFRRDILALTSKLGGYGPAWLETGSRQPHTHLLRQTLILAALSWKGLLMGCHEGRCWKGDVIGSTAEMFRNHRRLKDIKQPRRAFF